jgi:hypothetical protein
MSVGQLRVVGTIGLASALCFVVAFVLDPLPPTAGASAATVLDHTVTSSGNDRAAAFLFALSAAGLVVFIAGVRAWFETISSTPRWWGSAMFGGSILTAASLVVTSGFFFLLSSHAPANGDVAAYLNDGINYGFIFAGFGVLVTVGFLAALMVTTGGPLSLLGRIGVAVTMVQVLFLATVFFTSGPLVAGGIATIVGFAATGLFVTLTAIAVLWFARLMAAAARPR